MNSESLRVYSLGTANMVLLGVFLVLIGFMYKDGFSELLYFWENREEYSHGYLIPLISLYLLWQNKNELLQLEFRGSVAGILLLLFGILIYLVGTFGAVYIVVHYSLLMVLGGFAWAMCGTRAVRYLWIPVFFLFFMIPLPPFLYNQLSGELQLISSQLGVEVIRLFGISVFLEGNVIDLGQFQLQVVEACNGLRYLFPLTSFGFLLAYLFNAPLWQRAVVFLSTIPITVLMNSFRIGVIGVLVENWGIEQAEGFLHDFEGWVIFMACIGILVLEMWIFTRFFSREKRPLMEVFGLEYPDPIPEDAVVGKQPTGRLAIVSVLLVGISMSVAWGLGQRPDISPERKSFVHFPIKLDDWRGYEETVEDNILEALHLSDYIKSTYRKSNRRDWVGLWIAYYDKQKAGEAAHSPRSCIPGGGWEIESLTQEQVEGVEISGQPLVVNRLVIAKGEHKQLVYYWFKQRERLLTNEYLLKWYLFTDAVTRQRTDGALVRLITALEPGEELQVADDRLTEFLHDLDDVLVEYIPD